MNARERMVISAHSDGEVEAPWKERVEAQLAADPAWAAEAAAQARLREVLLAAPEPDFQVSQQRVWERLEAACVPAVTRWPSWVAVAAAAVVLFAAGAGYWVGRSSPEVSTVAELQVQVPQQIELKLSGEGQLMMASTVQGIRP